MLIQFLDKRYEVVQKVKAADALDLYVVKDRTDPEQKLYTAACIKDHELARKLILVTTKRNTSLAFKDLQESFNADGKYYIVFSYAQGETLQRAMGENAYSLEERLLLMKNIFGQILLLDMPDCFIYEALRKDSIVVDAALSVRFNYFFTEVDYYWQVDEKNCLQRISGLVLELFRKELEEKRSRELAEFSRNLEQGRFTDIWDCYEAYNDIYEDITWKSGRQELRPGRIWWRAWEAFKKKMPALRSMLAVLLILASGIYLLLHLPNPVLSEDGITFLQIGTLEIREQGNGS